MKKINMKNWVTILSLMTLATLFALTSCNSDEDQHFINKTQLVLNEDFNTDGSLNNNIWQFDIGRGNNGWGNNELQYYTSRQENVSVRNGYLLITANREDYEGANYTSGRIISRDLYEQQYGRFEARIKLPYGKGMWPAFWLLGNNCDASPWPGCGEIDIMEFRGQEPTIVHGSMHSPKFFGGNAKTKSYTLENSRFDTDFHVFGIEWTPEYVNYYVDDDMYYQIRKEDLDGSWVFDHPFYIIINLAVGGSYVGNPNENTVFPQTMLVDYVRVYQ